ncbi:four-helix bundle copper-binding protein [Aquimarina algiphila]|uniref:Four-helix bundle copper-binding protein n=1 Tax=Aquimarina algiphila TaxID=2047982 RepID=A0A554VLT6_9FLAO|nr:four-helix bundle copper-binding protein [Aquimarina algiphila]TSE09146.1 four-helix bundle copper-binding protein [Aquimarina algiphila]
MENIHIIEALINCAAHCRNCAYLSLKEENVNELQEAITNTLICAEICEYASELPACTESEMRYLLKECKTSCKKCAKECEKLEYDYFKKCAAACEKCIDVCNIHLVEMEIN